MSANVTIVDNNSGFQAKVTKFGQLVISPLQYSEPVSINLNVDDEAFNFIKPQQDHSIVITDIIVDADNAVSNVTPAEVEIYEATTDITTTITKGIYSPRVVRDNLFKFCVHNRTLFK